MGGMSERIRSSGVRWALSLVVFVAALALCRRWCLNHQAFLQSLSPGCTFRRLTGFCCPGCGGTRAFFALLKGDVLSAWRMNSLLLSGLALLCLFALMHGLEWLAKGAIRWSDKFRVTSASAWWLCGAVLAFWILRNLPWWPFTWLAP